MLKINELNRVFKRKRFFLRATAYNDLLGYARGLARNVDAKDAQIRTLKEEIEALKKKYVGGLRRDRKTGQYLKRKK